MTHQLLRRLSAYFVSSSLPIIVSNQLATIFRLLSIGIAMGSGTDVAKLAADMVLAT
jgi:hypothetical protein